MSWGNPHTIFEKIYARLLTPVASFYQALVQIHKWSYEQHWLSSGKLGCPVVSIGNLTVGGTGKTPIIVDLAKQLIACNLKVAILSRGYKRKDNRATVVVSDGQGQFSSIEAAGDEPLMMAQMLPQAVVISGSNRFHSGQMAISNYDCQVILLDDGFQHWKLERDYNIVLMDYNDEPWADSLLPAGRLREPLSALKRADHVVITKIPKVYLAEKIARFKEIANSYSPKCSFSLCRIEPGSIHQLINGKWTDVPLEKLNNLKVVAFCGLAKPQTFYQSLQDLGANVRQEISFADHHSYCSADIKTLQKKLSEMEADYLITTRKDLVKLERSDLSSRILALNSHTKWINGSLDMAGLVKTSSVLKEVV